MIGGPVKACQDTGEWSGIVRNAVCDNMQTRVSEAARIAIGIDDHLTALRCERGKDALENCFFSNADAGLIAAAHAARAAAGKDKTESGWDTHVCFACGIAVWLWALRRHWLPATLCYMDEARTPSQKRAYVSWTLVESNRFAACDFRAGRIGCR